VLKESTEDRKTQSIQAVKMRKEGKSPLRMQVIVEKLMEEMY